MHKYNVFNENGELINTIIASDEFAKEYCKNTGFELKEMDEKIHDTRKVYWPDNSTPPISIREAEELCKYYMTIGNTQVANEILNRITAANNMNT